MVNKLAKRWIGSKEFYKSLMVVALPIMLQNGISNFVGMLDNLMVGRIGTEQLSGVSIVNDLFFVFYLCLFGAISGAGIFTAQFYGQGNTKGVRDTFRIKLIICLVIVGVAAFIFLGYDKQLISLYLHEGSETGDLEATLKYGHDYIMVMLIGLVPCAFENVYSSTIRESGETLVPMKASIVAVFVNLILNYILIYGKLGFPVLGVVGAAIATVISRFVQAGIVVIWTHRHTERMPFIEGAYSSLAVPGSLMRKVVVMGLPLMINEILWSLGVVFQKQSYSLRGLAVVAGMNINSTIFNVFSIAFMALGDAVAIIVGQMLGAGKMEEAKSSAIKITVFSAAICIVMGSLIFFSAGVYPNFYNTSDEVKSLATGFLRVTALLMPISGILHVIYFTIRSGGKTVVTFLFDSTFMWVVSVPLAAYLTRATGLDIITIFALCEGTSIIKVIIGFILFEKGVWIQNIVKG